VPAAQTYGFLGTVISVVSDRESDIAWLREFLAPSFDPRPAEEADFTVEVSHDRARRAALITTRPRGRRDRVACFALDREVVHHPAWTTAGRVVVRDRRHGVYYVLRDASVAVIAADRSQLARSGVMRVIREIATARALAAPGNLQLHAAAVEIGGRGILFAGPKGSGKTTLLTYFLTATAARLISNDRVFAIRTFDGFDLRGVPTIVSVRPGTQELLPGRFGHVPNTPSSYRFTLAEADRLLAAVGGTDGTTRLTLSPAQLARELSVAPATEATLDSIVFPEPHPDPSAFTIHRLTLEEAALGLRGVRFGVDSGKNGPTVFEHLAGVTRPEGADAALISSMAEGIPCFSVRMGARLFGERHAADAIRSVIRCPQPVSCRDAS
jgi:hypothetical protein